MGIGDGKPSSPPWWSHALWGSKNREMSESWWKELGHGVPSYRKNKRNSLRAIKEDDSDWYDPPVKDGESMAGVYGMDSKICSDQTKKNHQPGNLYDFQKKIMKESIQYKQIAEKHEISDEHPGIAVSPNLKSLHHLERHQLGKGGPFYNNFSHIGPRFWDKPINEGCFEKGLCLVKYAALANICYTGFQLKAFPKFPFLDNWNSRNIFRAYLRNLPLPCVMSFAYGVGLCSSAQFRNQDDLWNFVVAGGLSGLILSSVKQNVPAGVCFWLGTSVLASFYQIVRTENLGLGPGVSHQIGGFPIASGPLAWKLYRQDSRSEIPERTHY